MTWQNVVASIGRHRKGVPDMQDVIWESWRGHTISIRAVPVRRPVTRRSATEQYVALVRIDAHGDAHADWHSPPSRRRWSTASEAQWEALRYAVQLIDCGVAREPVGTSDCGRGDGET
ncbi:hypothetical protein ACAX43_26435 [Paraburkholderia sp. IW21]|uniref:hypothetical protein n=1 Tax=Paraburkholderia sp. IW21 TaxID=3242488 RepID=UPI003522AED5